MSFADNLKEMRYIQGYSQKDVAEKLGISQPSYAQYESGKRKPKIETVQRIADALEVHIAELIDDWNIFSQSERDSYFKGEIDRSNSVIFGDILPKDRPLLHHYHELNEIGKDKAIEQVELLTKIPEYRKDSDTPSQE